MLSSAPATGDSAWSIITRFGESGVLLPLTLALIMTLVWEARPSRPALAWTLPIAASLLVAAASKIAFLGFALGIRSLDFTGFSGHATVAAAVYPMLAYMLTMRAPALVRATALALAFGLALLVMVSRFELGAHSPSEVVSGFVLGACASTLALRMRLEPTRGTFAAGALLLAMLVWAATPRAPGLFHSHDIITRIALTLSGRSTPFTREELHRQGAVPLGSADRSDGPYRMRPPGSLRP
jgi:hypothetical protein